MTAHTLTRRRFLGATGAAAAVFVTPRALRAPAAFAAVPTDLPVFTLGVASGDPTPRGVVLWTRLAPDPLHGGGMPERKVDVRWEVFADESLRRVVKQGSIEAKPARAHSVHAEVFGLDPDREYWYRFRAAGQESPVGRTRTAPAADVLAQRLRLAFVSCQDWQNGYWPAYRRLAEEDVDVVLHLGDYIYEYG